MVVAIWNVLDMFVRVFASFASLLLYTFPFLLCRAAFADDKWCISEKIPVHVDHDTPVLKKGAVHPPFFQLGTVHLFSRTPGNDHRKVVA